MQGGIPTMSYTRRIVAKEEKLIGIARLHWIYVIKGLIWFLIMAGIGWGLNDLMTRGFLLIGNAVDTYPALFISLANGAMYVMMGAGFWIFLLMVIKVLVTEVALTDRRVIHKEGLLFVKVKQIDLEEIRGESLDLGNLGRVLNYGYLLLDCRFIGDIRLPAIENAENFLKALHYQRSHTQDALNVVVGKGNPVPLNVVNAENQQSPEMKTPQPTQEMIMQMSQQQPDIQPGQQPVPEIVPPIGPSQPEIQPEPVPHAPPPGPSPVQPDIQPPQPAQPIPAPPPSEPPLQPPTNVIQGQPVIAQNVALTPEAVAQVVAQVMPQMAEQVVKQIANQGLLPTADQDNDVDKDLIHSFDEARFVDEDPHVLHDKLQHAVH